MKGKFSLLVASLLLTLMVAPLVPASATETWNDRIQGYVFVNGAPAEGLTVSVYRTTNINGASGTLPFLEGQAETNADGFFLVAYLYAHGNTYVVEVTTPCGLLTSEPLVLKCGQPVCVAIRCCTGPGTGTPGYWKNHPEAWPVDTITIGGVDYARDDAIAIMLTPVKRDKTHTMFGALVAAKLNVLIGNPSSCVDAAIADADAWMADYGPVGSGVAAGGKASPWRVGEPLYEILDDYNNGLLCAPHRD